MSKLKSNSFFYKNLINYTVKKGKKWKMELIFKKTLFILKKKYKNFNLIKTAFKYITPRANIKKQRRGAKYITIPLKISTIRARYLSSTWLLSATKIRNSQKFHTKMLEELKKSAFQKSPHVKKCLELNKLAYASLNKK